MKLFIITIAFSLISTLSLHSQDTLILNDGSELSVKVLEVGLNSITYKKSDNITGPNYTMDLSKVFMALYKDGTRETFQSSVSQVKNEEQQTNQTQDSLVLSDDLFEVRLVETKSIPDKKQKWTQVTATIDAYSNGKEFTKLHLTANQRKDIAMDFSNPKISYCSNSSIVISAVSEKVSNTLYEKYEKITGKGYGWALPPKFFSLDPSSCCIAILDQNGINNEVIGFGGITSTKFDLQDCTSLENKLLSVALIWLKVNFTKK